MTGLYSVGRLGIHERPLPAQARGTRPIEVHMSIHVDCIQLLQSTKKLVESGELMGAYYSRTRKDVLG